MTKLDIPALRKIAEAATLGPWMVGGTGTIICNIVSEDHPRGHSIISPDHKEWFSNEEQDADFIAAFNPQTALALLSEVGRLESELRDARQLIEADNAALKKAEAKLSEQSALLSEVERLNRENERMRIVLAFYADKKAWQLMELDGRNDDYEALNPSRPRRVTGGRRARECLASLDKDTTK